MEFSGPGRSPLESAEIARMLVYFSPLARTAQLRKFRAHGRIVDRQPILEHQIAAELEQFRETGGDPGADRHPLVHQRGERHVPAVIDRAEPLRVGNPDVGEIDLIEIRTPAGLLDRPHLDSRTFHVEKEHGETLVLRHIGIGAGQKDTIVGIMRAGGPDLLAVDDPLVAVAFPRGYAVPATSEPPEGSENSWHQIFSPEASGGR